MRSRRPQPNVSIIYVPARFAPDAIYEAVDDGIPLVVCITEGIPVLDMVPVYAYVQGEGRPADRARTAPGSSRPGEAKVGIMPGFIHTPGPVGLVSRSGTLTYEVVDALTRAGLGQTTAVGIGGDPIIGTSFVDVLALFQDDPATEAIVMIGEIGGTDEEDAARVHQRARHQAGRRLHRRADRAARASGWATPARSSPAAPARRPRRWPRSRRPASASRTGPSAVPGLVREAMAGAG